MAAQVTVITGPAGSGKTGWVLRRFRQALAQGRPGSTVWIAPTWRSAQAVRDRLLAGGLVGCVSPGVMTFDQFAEAVLQASPEPIRPLTGVMKRLLVRRLIDEELAAGRLRYFQPIAETSGFVDLICQFIGQLKQREIWPDQFLHACRQRSVTTKDDDLHRVYDAYQRCLNQYHLHDTEGRFWSAGEVLRQGRWRPASQLRLVVADGFTDFTPPQHQIFEILAGHTEQILFTLPWEPGGRRADLFAKPELTLAELGHRHPGLVHQELTRPAESPRPAMARLEANLFADPGSQSPADDTSGLEILGAPGTLREIELVGWRIKRLLVQGCPDSGGRPVRPGDIAVVFRSAADVDELVREAFGRLGIPVAVEWGQGLDRSPALAALVRLLRLNAEDWPFRQLLAAVSSNYFRPEWPEWQGGRAATAAERAVRRLQIPRGRQPLLEAMEREVQGGVAEETVAGLESAYGLLARLARTLDALPGRATLGEWATAWHDLARQTGLLRVMAEPIALGDGTVGVDDRTAWNRLAQALTDCDRVVRSAGRRPRQLTGREALAALLDLLGSVKVHASGDEVGRVRVLSAESVRALDIPYLFFAGLTEKSFPRPERGDRLYDEGERQRLIDIGLPLAAPAERNQDEMLLFYEVITCATRRMVLSYPAMDEKAQLLSPSPYLEDVVQASGLGPIVPPAAPDLSPVPRHDDPLTPAEFRVLAVAKALDGNVSLLAGLARDSATAEVAGSVFAGLRLVDQRQDRNRFGPSEGIVDGTAAGRELARHFGPDQAISATALEQYAACPFRFFVEKVLRLDVPEELALDADYLGRGRLVHEVLARFHSRLNQLHGRPMSPGELGPAEYAKLMSEVTQSVFRASAGQTLEAAMCQVHRRQWQRWAEDYYRQHQAYDELGRQCQQMPAPAWFEVAFGRTDAGTDLSTSKPLALGTPIGTVLISGRIDRIDVGMVAGKTVFNVIDYKTGSKAKFTTDQLMTGTALQLPLYALATSDLLMADRGAVGLRAGYWLVSKSGFQAQQSLVMHTAEGGAARAAPDWPETRRLVAQTVAALVGAIRRGQFPVFSADDDCTRYCPLRTTCRINHIRSLEKTWQPTPVPA